MNEIKHRDYIKCAGCNKRIYMDDYCWINPKEETYYCYCYCSPECFTEMYGKFDRVDEDRAIEDLLIFTEDYVNERRATLKLAIANYQKELEELKDE